MSSMVEVFKTDVEDPAEAIDILHQINAQFPDYRSNFDLQDPDRILRIENQSGLVDSGRVIELVIKSGYKAECL